MIPNQGVLMKKAQTESVEGWGPIHAQAAPGVGSMRFPTARPLLGQAALDFLMTYGWALMLIVLIAGALYALGIFDVGNFIGSRASGFTQVNAVGWRLSPSGQFILQVKNNAGTDINITSISATFGTETVSNTTQVSIPYGSLSPQMEIGTFPSASQGQTYSIRVSINYTDAATSFQYLDSGTVTGRAT
jgi:hypothetical protein